MYGDLRPKYPVAIFLKSHLSCVSFALSGRPLEKAICNSVPSGLVWVRIEEVAYPLASTNKLNGFEKLMTYNGSVVALHNNRFNSSNACWWIGFYGIFAGTYFAVKSVSGFATPAKFSIYSRK